MFYAPIIPYWLYLSLREKSFTFWDATNPAILRSGNGIESKYDTIQLIPEDYRPKTVLAKKDINFDLLLDEIENAGITFPLIAKPDIGFRGLLVEKIADKTALKDYIKQYALDFLIQELITYPNEIGVFYHRLPHASKGAITSITIKEFLTVIGDGTSTIEELISKDNRAKLYIDYIIKTGIVLKQVPKESEQIRLLNIGNHCKGARFVNGNHLIDDVLLTVFDDINKQIPNWYYGRLDIRFKSLEALKQGKYFKILEINGVISEPTHIYDAANTDMTYFKAVKTIKDHWKIVHQIARYNITTHKLDTPKLNTALKEIKALKKYTKNIARLAQ
jgi:hypothetical protein